jgi:hypothetical protein
LSSATDCTSADEFEQHVRCGLIFRDIGDIVEDEQVILVELGYRSLELDLPTCCLGLLDEVGCSREENAPSILDGSETKCSRQSSRSHGRCDLGSIPQWAHRAS